MNELTTIPKDQALQVAEPARGEMTIEAAFLAVSEGRVNKENLEVMKGLLAMAAEQKFAVAMVAACAEMPRIVKDGRNPSSNSSYAKLETVNHEIVPVYTKHGFTLSFGTAPCELVDTVRITCEVRHAAGHFKNYQIDVPLDILGAKGNPNKTRTQGFGSTLSYGRRYLILMIFNISVVGEDDDANWAAKKPKGLADVNRERTAQAADTTQKPAQTEQERLKAKLWATLKPVRGSAASWDAASSWLRSKKILPPTLNISQLTEADLEDAIAKAEICLSEQ